MLIRAVGNHVNRLRFQGATEPQSQKPGTTNHTQASSGQDRFEKTTEVHAADSEKLKAQQSGRSEFDRYLEKKKRGRQPSSLRNVYTPKD